MTNLWQKLRRNLALAGLLASGAMLASAAQFTGILMDVNNSANAEERTESGGLLAGGLVVAEAYTKEDALKPESRKAGYGIFTEDNKFLAFDEEGNRKALVALKSTRKEDDLRIEVTGEVKGSTIKVATLRLLP